jgi:cyclohexanecarboxylate-CoA ligase
VTVADGLGLWELVEARAVDAPDRVLAIDEDDRTLTAREFRDAAERAAAGLQARGVGPDVNVSWMLPTWLESAVLVAALARLGAVQNPMLPILGQREMRFITSQTGARLLVVPSEWRGRAYGEEARELAAERPGLEVLLVDRQLPEGDPATLIRPPPPVTAATAPVRWVFYTSGTTADPKGARHTDLTVKASAVGMIEALEITDADRAAMVFPFTHIGGIGWLFTMLMTGCTCVFVEAFVPQTTIPVLQRNRITLAGAGTPFHMAYLAAQRDQPDTPLFPEARAYPGGGAPKPPQLHYEVRAELGGVGVVSGYGLTETPILTMNTVHDSDELLAETEGRPTPGVELRFVKLDGEVADPGEEGEIRAKGPQMFRGYLDDSLDADAFDDEGWFRTGDLGRLDSHGHVLITGRVKDIIIRHGENISAKQVEDLLFTHPKIADAAVIGLPDPRTGERACAVVVPTNADDPPTLEELYEYLTDQGLAKQKVPEQLEIVDTLPRNPAGKVLKHELRSAYER